MKKMARLLSGKLLFIVTLCISGVSLAQEVNNNERVSSLYQSQYRTAKQLIDVLQPIFSDSAKLSRSGQTIVIDADSPAQARISQLLQELDQPPQRYEITLSNTPTADDTRLYSTHNNNYQNINMVIAEGKTITFVKQKDMQTVAGRHPFWQQVELIPQQQEFLQLNIQAAKETVYIRIKARSEVNNTSTLLDTTIIGEFDSWLPLLQPENTADTVKNYQTGPRTIEKLFLKVSKISN